MRMSIKQTGNVKLERGEEGINQRTELLMCVFVSGLRRSSSILKIWIIS